MQPDTTAVSIVAVFFKNAAIIIAGREILQKIYVLTCTTVIQVRECKKQK